MTTNQTKQQSLSLDVFCDNLIFSDIAVHFGVNDEQVFHGHKVVLSCRSRWFKAALTGQFKEGQSNKIVLKEDDPEALLAVLRSAYQGNTWMPSASLEHASHSDLSTRAKKLCLAWLSIAVVADKYAFPHPLRMALHQVSQTFQRLIEYVGTSEAEISASVADLLSVIRHIYEVPLSIGQRLRKEVFFHLMHDAVKAHGSVRLCGGVAKQHAEFAQDMFIRLMKGAEDELRTRNAGICSDCEGSLVTLNVRVSDEYGCPHHPKK